MVVGVGAGGSALRADVTDDGQSGPDERHRTEDEDAVQNLHRGEHNKVRQGVGGAGWRFNDAPFGGRVNAPIRAIGMQIAGG